MAALRRLLVLVTGQPDAWSTRCSGNCCQGRACTCMASQTELVSAHAPRLELVRSRPSVPVTLTGGRIPRARRVRRFLRALLAFFTAERFEL